MIRRYFYIFSASLFILITSTTGVKANIDDPNMETLARQTNSPPDGFNYQAVLRDDNGDILANSAVTMRFTLSDSGNDVWIETHAVTTDANGMITLVIGNGTKTGGSANAFADIDWSMAITVGVEADAGNGYVDLGSSELQSVPYANYAANGVTAALEAEIAANTAKVGITQAQADAIDANTLKGGITPEQETIIANTSGVNTGDQDISGIATNATAIATNEAAIALNTAKVGITAAQASEITANTAKVGVTTAQATTLANTSGVNTGDQDISGIATNATAIATNEAAIALNTAKVGITPAQAGEITANTAKVGITPAQAAEITANTAKISSPFENTANVIFAGGVNDDFVFGSTQLADAPGTDDDNRMFFDKSKGVFRVGGATGTQWDTPGNFSFAAGQDNIAFGAHSTIGGGHNNAANTSLSFVGGGYDNIVLGNGGSIVAGRSNRTNQPYSSVTGGRSNYANGSYSAIGGGYLNTTSLNYTTVGGGRSNSASNSYATVGGGSGNTASGWRSVIGGGKQNFADGSNSSVGGGYQNSAPGQSATVSGGYKNIASSSHATISGGSENLANNSFSAVGGGRSNTSSGQYAVISGGYKNTASFYSTAIGGGSSNTASDSFATVGGGSTNTAAGWRATVGGGFQNTASGSNSTVAGGNSVKAQALSEFAAGQFSLDATSPNATTFVATDRIFTIGNGTSSAARSNAMVILKNSNTDINGNLVANSLGIDGVFTLPTTDGTAGQVLQTDGAGVVSWQTASGGSSYAGTGTDSFVAGNANNVASANFSTVSGGLGNTASRVFATVGGGNYNYSTGIGAAVAGGRENNASGDGATIAGGYGNVAPASYSSVGGGARNNVSGNSSVIAGGTGNTATGTSSTVSGGRNNTTSGYFSTVAGGHEVNAQAFGEFATGVFSANAVSPNANSFIATDRIFTVGNGTGAGSESNALVILKNGNATLAGTLTQNSDRRLKREIAPLGNTLDKVNEMEGVTYKWNNLTPRDTTEANIGLIAQEVEALFPELVKTGDNGYKSVNYIQLVPVLIEAIKELSQENDALETANAKMEERQQGDDEKFAALEAKLDYLMQLMTVEASVSTTGND